MSRADANKIKLLHPHTPHLSGNTDRAQSFISADGGEGGGVNREPWQDLLPAGHSM